MAVDGLTFDRVVAVRAAFSDGTELVASGYLVDACQVLTVAHAIRPRDHTSAGRLTGLRVVQVATGACADVVGTPLTDPDLDVAVLTVDEDAARWVEPGAPDGAWRVNRLEPGVLADCVLIGVPRFAYDPSRGVQGTAELHGDIYQTDGAETGHLVMRDPRLHGPHDPDTGRSGWDGLSGALVFYRRRPLGVVVEHHPALGDNSVKLISFEKITSNEAIRTALKLPTPQQLEVAMAGAGASGPAQLVVGQVPVEPFGYQRRAVDQQLQTTLLHPGVSVLVGLPGTGKTQLAATSARDKVAAGWPLVAWVSADGRDRLLAGLAELADAVGVADPDGDSQRSAERLRDHLQATTAPLLLVLDDVTDPELVRPFMPGTGSTRVLLTSTDAAAGALGTRIKVGVFERAESTSYLTARTEADDPAGAAALAEAVGDLPLALAQAAAVVAGPPQIGYSELLEELALLPVEDTLCWQPGHDYPRAVGAALLLAVQAAEQAGANDGEPQHLTSRLLRVAAVLNPTGIQPDLLAGLAPDDLPATIARKALRDAEQRCLSHGLFTPTELTVTTEPMWVMHRLVARVLRDRDAAAHTLPDTITSALELLEPRLFPSEQAWQRRHEGDILVGHIQALNTTLPEPADPTLAVRLVNARAWAARQLHKAEDLSRAILLMEQNLADRERLQGPDHSDTLRNRENLASAYQDAGNLKCAIALCERTLADRLRLMAPDDPQILASRNNLAVAYKQAGDLSRAIALLEQNRTDSERVFGPLNAATLASRRNLAGAYQKAGDLSRAIALLEQNRTDSEQVLGPDHADTLTARNNLAGAYAQAGDLRRAIRLYQETLAESERVLGVDHPETVIARNNLAYAYYKAGDLRRAIPLYQRTLNDAVRVLGSDHPRTLSTAGNLAVAHGAAGEHSLAIPLLEQNVTDRERILGPDHPDTLVSRNNLATAYLKAGDRSGGIRMLERNVTDSERILGLDHPQTLAARKNLDLAHRMSGHPPDALA